MKIRNLFLTCIFITCLDASCLTKNINSDSAIENTGYGIKLNTDFYEILDYDALLPVYGNPKIITTQNYYNDLKEWGFEDSSVYDDKGRLVYLYNYPYEKSFIYNKDKIIYESRKDSREETYVYWFFYDTFNNPKMQIIAVRNNLTGEYSLNRVEKYYTTYYKDSVVVSVKSSKEYIANAEGTTSVFDTNGNLKYKSYINDRGVKVYKAYLYKKIKNKYVLQEKRTEATLGAAKSIEITNYTLDKDGIVLREELTRQGIFNVISERFIVYTTFLKDSTKQIIHNSYNGSNIQRSYQFEYDKYGNNTKKADIEFDDKNSYYISLYEYKYDSQNNWISKIEYMQETDKDLKPTRKKMKLVTFARKITYYDKIEKYVPEKVPEIPDNILLEVNNFLKN